MKTKPSRLSLWDFDGTLVRTPSPETLIDGVPARQYYDDWLEANGRPKRRFSGWWGRTETLYPPIFGSYNEQGGIVPPPDALNQDLAEFARAAFADENTLSVLMTGRHVKMVHPDTGVHLSRLHLESYGIACDRYYYVAGGAPTINFKAA